MPRRPAFDVPDFVEAVIVGFLNTDEPQTREEIAARMGCSTTTTNRLARECQSAYYSADHPTKPAGIVDYHKAVGGPPGWRRPERWFIRPRHVFAALNLHRFIADTLFADDHEAEMRDMRERADRALQAIEEAKK